MWEENQVTGWESTSNEENYNHQEELEEALNTIKLGKAYGSENIDP